MAESKNGATEAPPVTWKADSDELGEALLKTDRALRKLSKAITQDGDTERALKLANNRIRANRRLREPPQAQASDGAASAPA